MKPVAEMSPWAEQERLDQERRWVRFSGVKLDLVTSEWIVYHNGRICGWYKTPEEAGVRLEELA